MAKLTLSKIKEAMNKQLVPSKSEELSPIVQQEIDSANVKKYIDPNTFRKAENLSDVTGLPVATLGAKAKMTKGITSSKELTLPTKKDIIDFIKELEALPENSDEREEEEEEIIEILAVGRRSQDVSKTIFGDGLEDFVKKNKIGLNEQFVSDPVRGCAARYWTLDEGQKSFKFLYDNRELSDRRLPYRFVYRGNIVDDRNPSDFGRTQEWLILESNKKLFVTATGKYSKDLWSTYLMGGEYKGSSKDKENIRKLFPLVRQKEAFYDHVADIDLPFEKKYLDKMNVVLGAMSYDSDIEYNFYIKEYEESITRDKVVLENTLPNIYVMLGELNIENPNPEFRNFITLDNKLETGEKVLQNKNRSFDIKTHPIGQYYDLYGRQYHRIAKSGDTVARLNRRFSNIAFSIDEMKMFNDYNEKREMFPMYVDINFSTEKTTSFAQILDETDFSDLFLTKVMNKQINGGWKEVEVNTSVENIVQRSGEDNLEKTNTFSPNRRRYLDVSKMILEMREPRDELDLRNSIYVGDYEKEAALRRRGENKFYNSLMYTIMASKVQTLIKQKMRTYKEMVEGKKAYSETVLYRIAKFEGSPEGKEPIQNSWFSNSNKIDMLRYIDTQVKYDKEYTYVVFAYQLVFGTKYWYSDLDADSFEKYAVTKVYQEPSLRLVEIPFFSVTGRVMDNPPVIPDLEFFPYKGVDDKIGVFLRGNVGDYKMQPIIISQKDAEHISKLRKIQKLEDGEPLRYKADDHPKSFEIYRLEKKPKNYQEFSGKMIASVSTDVSAKTPQKATSATFVDSIEPNKKYYYTFRTIDNHNHFSNPTVLYEVEMINESGTIFPIIRVVDFEKRKMEYKKPARRHIQLVPNVLHSLINEEKTGYVKAKTAEDIKNNVHLGVLKEGLWKKRFKVRLTSKATGRKIDFNVKFDYKPEEKV